MTLDLVVLAIVFLSALVAFFRGLIKEVLTIFGLVGAALSTIWFGPVFGGLTASWFPAEGKMFDLIPWKFVALGTAYILVFVLVLAALSVLAHYASKLVRAAGLGPIDRSLGVVFGLARGVILVGLLYLPFHIILTDEQKQQYFGNAKTYSGVTYVAELMQALLPTQDEVKGAKDKLSSKDEPIKQNESFDPLKGSTGAATSVESAQ